MENQKRLIVIEDSLKIALHNLELLKEEQDKTELSLMNERLNKLEETLEQGYEGKGRLERLLEKVAREPLIFLPKGFKLKLEVMTE